MKHRNGIIAMAILMLLTLISLLSQVDSQQVSAQQIKTQSKTQQKIPPRSSRIKGVIKGSEKPDQIPEMVAFELFLRTVAEGNARGLVKDAGFNDDQTEIIMGEAHTFSLFVDGWDRQAFLLKTDKENLQGLNPETELPKLQKTKDDWLAKTVDKWLPQSLGKEGFNKLRNFINSGVKSNIQKILLDDPVKTKEFAFYNSFVNPFAPKKFLGGGGQLYYYSAAWNDGFAVYGSGSLSEQYGSDTSYRATVSVTSPSQRSNTTASDWGSAPIVSNTGLSIGDEDGTYSIQADFEEQDGYYDEYGNFFGTGSFLIGSSANGSDVPPLITLVSVVFLPPTIPPVQGTISNATAIVSYSNNVPQNTTVGIEVNDGPSGGNPLYVINPISFDPPNGGVPTGNFNRTARLTVPAVSNSPRSVRVTFPFQLSQNTGPGTVFAQIRLGGVVVPSPAPSPAVTVVPPLGLTATLTIAAPSPTPTPTPNPSPSPVASGPCNPSTLLLGWCFAGGGDYIYPTPPCGCTTAIEKSPILIDTTGNGFAMTNAANGVSFDLLGFGFPLQLSWTAANSDDAWLALDRNQNNRIDTGKELFGNATQQPDPPAGEERQGFLALAVYDKAQKGGNGDGKITRKDAVFKKLRLWIDRNHNGISEAEELYRLPALDVVAVRLDYQVSNRVDEFGNRFKYRARVRDRANANVGRWAWDVFLNTEP